MLATAVIVFREVLEAALLVGIIAAATRGVAHRARWLAAGILAGLAGAGLVALFTERIAGLASGMGQELFHAGVLGVAVLMLAWHNIWMSAGGAALAADARAVGAEVREGRRARSVLLVVVGLAILREGSETVLFLYGIAASDGGASWPMFIGAVIGILAGVAVGGLLYAGLLRIPLRWFFAATGALVLFVAAGMASQAARYLVQADVLPGLADPAWDTSQLMAPDSVTGALLHTLLGYDARPAGIQVVFYVATLAIIGAAMYRAAPGRRPRAAS